VLTSGTSIPATLWQFPTEYMAAPAPGTQFVELDNTDGGTAQVFYWLPGATSNLGGFAAGSYVSTDFVISSIVIKMADNGGTGIYRAYKADTTQLGSDLTWTRNDNLPGLLETDHQCLIIQAGTNYPVNIKSVQVFSKYPLTPGLPASGPTLFGGGR
jgi:hypothetical protein